MILVLLLLSPAAFVLLGWFTEAYRDTAAASEVSHRLHEVVFGIMFSIALVAAVTLLLRPKNSLASLIQLIVTLVTLSLVVTLTVAWDFGLLLYLVPLLGIVIFRRRGEPARAGPVWRWAVFLVAVALLPFVVQFEGHVGRALAEAQNHTTHWSAIAAFSAVLLILGAVVAIRVTGYRMIAMSLAAAAAAYGLVSLFFPYDASSHRPGYAIGLILWAGAWAVGLRYLDRPLAGRVGFGSVVKWVGMVPLALVVTMIWLSTDTPPNVPHRPDPEQPDLVAADVNRFTCLDCHGSETGGAPTPPHSQAQLCEGEPCWGGRTDCAGCHRIDPALGGPTDQIEVASPGRGLVAKTPNHDAQPLTVEDMALAETIGVGG